MTGGDPTAIVTANKIYTAYAKGNQGGVERLAKFVCARSFMPVDIYEACQAQRFAWVELVGDDLKRLQRKHGDK